MKTAAETRQILATNQAKEWGYKSIKNAENDGYNVVPVSVSVSEVSDALSISTEDVRVLFNFWKNNEGGQVSMCANLDCYYFPLI